MPGFVRQFSFSAAVAVAVAVVVFSPKAYRFPARLCYGRAGVQFVI